MMVNRSSAIVPAIFVRYTYKMVQGMAIKEKADRDTSSGGEYLDLGRLDSLLGFHLRMATAALYRDFAGAMEGTGLTQKLFAVLELIDANPEVSQVDISATLETDRATVMALVNRLEKRGLVARRRSERDRRRLCLVLTASGRSALGDARRRIAAHEGTIAARLGSEGAADLVLLLKRIYAA